ncbi:MAG: hypothetical protein OXG36_09765 [Caldilineaceae bacterium]|nr:hypothetical protein [Caldilineaceae bacterium]
MTITGINHGLSIYTGADGDTGAATADNRRLGRPVDGVVTNCFNDATSVFKYRSIYGALGHEGIDFDCRDASVVAMYGGVVVETKADWPKDGDSSGNYVRICFCTNPDARSDFQHVYLHLSGCLSACYNPCPVRGRAVGFGPQSVDRAMSGRSRPDAESPRPDCKREPGSPPDTTRERDGTSGAAGFNRPRQAPLPAA